MSKYIPYQAVSREINQQAVRRIHIERSKRTDIDALKTQLKTSASVETELQALGLTANHARSLNERLQLMLQAEEKFKGEPEPVVAPIKDVWAGETGEMIAHDEVFP